jgi:hypothetical protein
VIPITEPERTEANEADEGEMDAGAAARTICLQACSGEIPSRFIPFVSFCEPNFGVRPQISGHRFVVCRCVERSDCGIFWVVPVFQLLKPAPLGVANSIKLWRKSARFCRRWAEVFRCNSSR